MSNANDIDIDIEQVEEPEVKISGLPQPDPAVAIHYQREYSPISPFGEVSLQNALNFRIGSMYFSGLVLGGTYGFFEGSRKGKKLNFKLRLNSILNAMGRRGAALSSRLAVMGMYLVLISFFSFFFFLFFWLHFSYCSCSDAYILFVYMSSPHSHPLSLFSFTT